ncbi:MAG: type II toxin-antitoxin system Phd/YefM family antitoxin [Gemmatimonadota bacterium]
MTRITESISLSEAKANLSESVRRVERGASVTITRHGKPVAALVPVEDIATLERLRAAGPDGGLSSVAGGWEGSDELVERIRETSRSKPRKVRSIE